MKSYETLELCLENKLENDFIFKQNVRNKIFSLGKIENIIKFQKKHKCNLYEYVDYSQSVRLFFYVELINNKSVFTDIFNNIIDILKFNKSDLIIIQENDYLYRIIHKYYYFDTFEDLDNYLFQYNLFNIKLDKLNFLPSMFNNDVIIFDKYNFSDTLLNNIESLLKYPYELNIKKKVFTQKYINSIDFNDYDTLFIKSGMGSGKSTTTVNYIKNNNISSFLILSCRRTLTYTIYDKLKQNNIDVNNYITTSKENIKMCDKLIISPDSINKLDFPLKKFDFIWIDEGVSFMYYIGNYLCINRNTNSSFINILEWLLKNCNKLLITDADLNDNVIKFYLYFRNLMYCNLITYNNFSNNIIYNLFDNEKEILEKLKNDYLSNNKIYICCDTLNKSKFIFEYLNNLNITNKLNNTSNFNDILLYNSETDKKTDKLMYDVNSFWSKYNVVIVSPKVVFGVDFNLEYFDYVYGFYKCTTLNVREAFQQLHRIRNIVKNTINIQIYEKLELSLCDTLTSIKANIQNSIINNIFYKKTKNEYDHIVNCISYNITNNGYKYINMNNVLNYLIIYCIYEKNLSLNNFSKLMRLKITNIKLLKNY
tara:strand:- start:3090 stop:4874 length:1785 start_codon:yes stop_codon:yes gene_type:complete